MRLALGADTVEAIDAMVTYIKEEVDAWKEISLNIACEEVLA